MPRPPQEQREQICRRCRHLRVMLFAKCANPDKAETGGACVTSPKRYEPWRQYEAECVHWGDEKWVG